MKVTTYKDGIFELRICAPFLQGQDDESCDPAVMTIPGWESELSERPEIDLAPAGGIAVEYYQLWGHSRAGIRRQSSRRKLA
ncbi:hypothetical protein ACELLULO517_00510 [Acidisoma cellulosilytica]|uniref:Uncharacterized protein n=1 Tax=Acidisoma cellulosilyticum TaxID=2802395 RepID=A0A963YXA5_9PROT|nr:hypothetical protein [Acidisoma cellulosilyticum]MCB8878696.1 hypothetical protein [Acidisoma cellulosilyticum]